MTAPISKNDDQVCSSFLNYFFDDCAAFIEQVPESFDLGTVEVRLSCMMASANYCAIGSQCGALFLFNRKICQSVRPLRTSYDEIITCLSAFSCDNGREYLAVGHRSGTLIVLYLPTSHPNGTRKLKQSILEDAHSGSAIICLDWSSDGTKLFSADSSGQVIITHVDFENNEFINTTICEEREVLYLKSSGEYLAIATDYFYKIVNISNNCVIVVQRYLEDSFSRISGITFQGMSTQLLILLRNGEILAHNLQVSSGPFKFKNLNKTFQSAKVFSRTCSTNSSSRKELIKPNYFDVDDFLLARVNSFCDGRFIIYYTNSRLLVCRFECQQNSNVLVKAETFDLYELFGENAQMSSSLEIVDLVCGGDDELFELFILASNQRVYRLGALPAPPALLQSDVIRPVYYSAPSMGVLLNSLSTVAQKSGKNLFERFQATGSATSGRGGGVSRLVDNFLAGGSATGRSDAQSGRSTASLSNHEDSSFSSTRSLEEQTNQSADLSETKTKCAENDNETKTEDIIGSSKESPVGSPENTGFTFLSSLHPKSLRLSEKYSSKISSNFQNIFEHLKNTNLLSDFDSQSSKRGRVKEDFVSEISSSVTGEFSESLSNHDDETVQTTIPLLDRNVNVSRRKKTKFAKRNSMPFRRQNGSNFLNQLSSAPPPHSIFCQSNETEHNDVNAISDANLEKILGVIGLAEFTPTSKQDADVDLAADIVNPASITEDENDRYESHLSTDGRGHCSQESYGPASDREELKICLPVVGRNEWAELTDDVMREEISKEERYVSLEEVEDKKNSSPMTSMTNVDRTDAYWEQADEGLARYDDVMPLGNDIAEPEALFNSDGEDDRMEPRERANTSISSITSVVKPFGSDYPTIAAQIDANDSSRWRVLPQPPFGALGAFDVSADFVVACPPDAPTVFPALFRRLGGRPPNAVQRPHILRFDATDSSSSSWQPLKWHNYSTTSAVAVNDDGTITWRIVGDVVLMAKSSLAKCADPSVDVKWDVQTGEAEGAVIEMSIAGQSAWYLAKNGVFVQMQLPEMGIFYRAECIFPLKELAASENAVWALNAANGNLVIRSGLRHCPMGVDWIEDSMGHGLRFVSVALHGRFGFGLDRRGRLWMNAGVTKDTPFGAGFWYKVESLDFAIAALLLDSTKRPFVGARDKWRVRASSKRLLVSLGTGLILAAPAPLFAHLMLCKVPRRLSIYNRFELMSAASYRGKPNDNIYLICKSDFREVFAYSVEHKNFVSLPPISRAVSASFRLRQKRQRQIDAFFDHDDHDKPSTDEILCLEALRRRIVAISACRERVVVVDDAGDCLTYPIAGNLRSNGGDGEKDWSFLQLPTVNEHTVKLISVAVSSVALWAIDAAGRIFYAPAPSIQMSGDFSHVSWTSVSLPSPILSKINEVRVSARTGRHVWVFDSLMGECWSRGCLTLDNPTGHEWAKADNSIRVDELAVGEDGIVWALSPCNAGGQRTLYKLVGQTDDRPAGKGWMPIMTTRLSRIAADSADGRVWALDDAGRIVRHEMKMYCREDCEDFRQKLVTSHSEVDKETSADWSILEERT